MKKYVIVVVVCLMSAVVYADSLNCREIGAWPFGPSYAVALDPARNLAFLSSGGGVYILNVSDPSSPVKVSDAIHTKGVVYGLYYQSNRLYIAADEAGLEIWDVSNSTSPEKMGYYHTPGRAFGVAVSGDYAYVADWDSGLRVVSVSDPTNPQEVGYYDTPGLAYGVAVSGDYAYVADGGSGLRVVSVSDPTNPQEVGYYETPGYAYNVAVSNDYAYVADGSPGLRVVSVSDPSNPQEVGYYETPGYAYNVAVSGDYAYVADEEAGLRIIEFFVTGVEERFPPMADGSRRTATVVRNVLKWETTEDRGPKTEEQGQVFLIDVSGRKVMELHPGLNDVRHLAPGVYFVITSSPFSSLPEGERNKVRGRSASSVHKVIVTE